MLSEEGTIYKVEFRWRARAVEDVPARGPILVQSHDKQDVVKRLVLELSLEVAEQIILMSTSGDISDRSSMWSTEVIQGKRRIWW